MIVKFSGGVVSLEVTHLTRFPTCRSFEILTHHTHALHSYMLYTHARGTLTHALFSCTRCTHGTLALMHRTYARCTLTHALYSSTRYLDARAILTHAIFTHAVHLRMRFVGGGKPCGGHCARAAAVGRGRCMHPEKMTPC